MNPIAEALNEEIALEAPAFFDCISQLGREVYFPKGIISQSNEAKQHATRYNATIGIAEADGKPMVFSNAKSHFKENPADIFPYAPTGGRKKLRELWKKDIQKKNPSLAGKDISLPFVSGGITHGISLFADMFLDKDDVVLIPDKFWGNYRLTFSVLHKAKIVNYRFFTDDFRFDTESFAAAVEEAAKTKKKLTVIFNFPNNPTGYTCTKAEGEKLASTLMKAADSGVKIVAAFDDAYFGLFFEDCLKESLFSQLAGAHENIICVKLDGATKELFYWGARVGFLTLAVKCQNPGKVYAAVEGKLAGLLRGGMSNLNHHAQTVVEQLLEDPQTSAESANSFNTLKARAAKIKELHKSGAYDDLWTPYPFNSGYFMCVKLKNGLDAEKLRLHLLHKHQTGVIATAPTDIRVAFSCLNEEDIQGCFDVIAQGCRELLAK